MQNARNIYESAIVRLPSAEKLRLTTMILRDLSEENAAAVGARISALEVINELPAEAGVFDSSAAVDVHLKTERES